MAFNIMAIGKIRELFEPLAAALKASLSYETCNSFVSRKAAENAAMLASGEINHAQASGYLNMLQETAKFMPQYDGQCVSIVARASRALNGMVAKK